MLAKAAPPHPAASAHSNWVGIYSLSLRKREERARGFFFFRSDFVSYLNEDQEPYLATFGLVIADLRFSHRILSRHGHSARSRYT